MRTVFVNPTYTGNFKANLRKRRRKNPSLVLNPFGGRRRRRRRNPMPSLKGMAIETAMLAAGAAAGAALNRVGLQHVGNFYIRNGARIAAAGVLAALGDSPLAHAAAGAALAPMLSDVEMQLAAPAAAKNPHELAAELATLLEADLEGDDDLSDDDLEDELDF